MHSNNNMRKLSLRVISLVLTMALMLATFAACSKPATPDVTVPTDPTTASDIPGRPTDPSDPTKVTDPTDPVDPTDPTDPVDPTEDPTEAPTDAPTEAPTDAPTEAPTAAPTEKPTEAPTAPPTEPPTEPEPMSTLNGKPLADFAIIYSNEDYDYSKRAAQYVQSEILARTGLELPLVEDSDNSNAKYEIVVGETSRAISSRLTPPSKTTKFAILTEENQIALEGEYFVIAAAAYYFIATYVPEDAFEAVIPMGEKIYDPIVEKADNFIILIGDGMGVNNTLLFDVLENNVAYGDGEEVFYGYYLPNQGMAKTRSTAIVTDSAAAGTALACGIKTKNGYVGQDKDHQEVESITELAGAMGMSTAVMSTEVQTGATPAAFSAHADDRDMSDMIKKSQQELQSAYGTIIDCGYDTYTTSGVLSIENKVRSNLKTMGQNENGFFMMYEEAYTDKHNHDNNMDMSFKALVRFNQVIATVMEYAFYNPNTFVIITADHETGGLTMKNGTYIYTSNNHTSKDVPVFAYGYRAELFGGKTIENVQIPQTIASFMGVDDFGDQTQYKALTK